MKRTASARWNGDLKQGTGSLTTQSGMFNNTPYNFSGRFADGTGTNPEELIAAAHTGCFTMALSAALSGAGHVPEQVDTKATLSLEQVDGNWTITAIHLDCTAKVPGLNKTTFDTVAAKTKEACIVSRVLNATITLTATLL